MILPSVPASFLRMFSLTCPPVPRLFPSSPQGSLSPLSFPTPNPDDYCDMPFSSNASLQDKDWQARLAWPGSGESGGYNRIIEELKVCDPSSLPQIHSRTSSSCDNAFAFICYVSLYAYPLGLWVSPLHPYLSEPMWWHCLRSSFDF